MNAFLPRCVEPEVKRTVSSLHLVFLLAFPASGWASLPADPTGDKPMPPPPLAASAPVPPANPPFVLSFPVHHFTHTYPWRSAIPTTVFWIGNEMPDWVSGSGNMTFAPGGPLTITSATGYGPANGVLKINPFYVALPFNDLKFPDLARKWVPSTWLHPSATGAQPVSVCQGRWLELKSASGRVCFAQWEDVGPRCDDDAAYVFGSTSPREGKTGLDVSPAVAKYLGIDRTALISWRFVEDADVLPGAWLRYDEQKILYQALRDQQKGK